MKNINITVEMALTNPPPAAISNLTALTGTSSGTVRLRWTAPGEDGMSGTASGYVVKVATTQITSALFASAPTYAPSPPWSPRPGGTDEGTNGDRVVSGLTPGVTYYFAIKAFDASDDPGEWISPLDISTYNPANLAMAAFGIPSPPTGLIGSALSSSSLQWSWNGSANAATYQLLAHPSGALAAQTNGVTYTETGFSVNTAVSRTVRAGNASGFSASSADRTVYTLANTPAGLSVTSVGQTDITVKWAANGNPSGTAFRLERSRDGVLFSSVTLTTALTYQDTGLLHGTLYYYRVAAVNGDGVATAPSNVASATTLPKTDNIAPDQPLGLKGNLDPSGSAFTLLWEPVSRNEDGTPITDLAGYNIYRRVTVAGSPTKLNASPINVTAYADLVNGQVYYYTIRAIDANGNESVDSLIADSSDLNNVIFLGPDSRSTVTMPESVNDLLRSEHNKYGVPLSIRMADSPVSENSNILRSVRLELIRGDTKETLKDLAFARPQVVIGLAYNSVGGQVGRGAPNAQAGAPAASAAGVTPDQLSIYWFNGVTWVKVGGTHDPRSQTIKTKTSFLGSYQLRVAARASTLSLDQANVYPRVFTPNGDGFNDRVYFVLENPNGASVKGQIFDMAGRLVVTLPPPAAGTGIGTTFIWDGKDANGATAPSGVYVYRIEGEGQTFTGTVAVAR